METIETTNIIPVDLNCLLLQLRTLLKIYRFGIRRRDSWFETLYKRVKMQYDAIAGMKQQSSISIILC
jgi:hypothetical protein